jgi:hypothetical protein
VQAGASPEQAKRTLRALRPLHAAAHPGIANAVPSALKRLFKRT